jgi:hypothetical protein
VKEVRTGRAYVMDRAIDRAELERIAFRAMANGVIESVHFEPFIPEQFPAGQPYTFNLRTVEIRKLNDDQLKKLADKFKSKNLAIGSVVAPVWPPTGGGSAMGSDQDRKNFDECCRLNLHKVGGKVIHHTETNHLNCCN